MPSEQGFFAQMEVLFVALTRFPWPIWIVALILSIPALEHVPGWIPILSFCALQYLHNINWRLKRIKAAQEKNDQ